MLNSNEVIHYRTIADGAKRQDEMLANFRFDLKDRGSWEDMISERASYDQSKTSIRLERAYCRVYQPSHLRSGAFEPLAEELKRGVVRFLNTSGLHERNQQWTMDPALWGLVYSEGEACGPHGHGPKWDYSGVYYLKADRGSGSIYFPQIQYEVEPLTGDCVLFNSTFTHGVLPNVIEGAERVCVAFNVRTR